jgi:hypothetical protein
LLDEDIRATSHTQYKIGTLHLAPPEKDFPALNWSTLQAPLRDADFGVLLLLDYCSAAATNLKGSKGIMQTLSACGTKKRAIGPKYDGWGPDAFSPFTAALIRQLEFGSQLGEGLFITELLRAITQDLILETQTPHFSQDRSHGVSILLKPLREDTFREPQIPPPSGLQDLAISVSPEPNLMALVVINFRGELLPEWNQFIYWLGNLYPIEVSGVQSECCYCEVEPHACDLQLCRLAMQHRQRGSDTFRLNTGAFHDPAAYVCIGPSEKRTPGSSDATISRRPQHAGIAALCDGT